MPYSNINSVVLIGRLTRDPELRSLSPGNSVCDLRVACNTARRGDEGGYEERPNFFDVRVFGALAETVNRYLRKGNRLGVDGRLEWREWETDDQQRRQAVSIVADTVQFLDGPSDRSTIGQPRDEEPSDELGGGEELGGDEELGGGEERAGQEDRELVGVGAEEDLVF